MALIVLIAPLTAFSLERPNILVLMAEDLSTRLGSFGDAVAHTPNLDALAREGVRYTQVFTTSGVCAPSRAAHILGMHQIATGTQHMRSSGGPDGGYSAVPPGSAKAYPELLRAAGYFTYTDMKLDYQFSGTVANTGPFTIWSEEGWNTHWRQREPGQPFFGLVNFPVTHESGVFTPLGHWPHSTTHFVMQILRAVTVPSGRNAAEGPHPDTVVLPPYYPDTPTVRSDVARHYHNIAIMDRQVGELLAQLEADGLDGNTIVIWTTDHGDGLPRAKRELYDSGIRVPMIIRWPRAYRPPGIAEGSVDTRLVSFVDLAPTILRMAGVAVPSHLHGRDFVLDPPRRYVYAARDRIDAVVDRQRAVRDGRFKYIRRWYPDLPGGHPLAFRDNIAMVREMRLLFEANALSPEQALWFQAPGAEQLYDTQSDPHELVNLIGDSRYTATLARMRRELDSWLARVGDWSEQPEAQMAASFRIDGGQPVTPPPVVRQINTSVLLTGHPAFSLAYSLDDAPWQIYTAPFEAAKGTKVEARAVRYGWEASEIRTLTVR